MNPFKKSALTLLLIPLFSQSWADLTDPSAMDTTISPCDNFYQYSCGSWIKKTQLPADQSIWDRGFNSGMPEKTNQELVKILNAYSNHFFIPKVPYAQQLGDF